MDSYKVQIAVNFCNTEAEPAHNLMTRHEELYIIGDGSGITHNLPHLSDIRRLRNAKAHIKSGFFLC